MFELPLRLEKISSRIAVLLSVLLCVVVLELCWLTERRARLLLSTQEELVVRDSLTESIIVLRDELTELRLEQKKINRQIDIMMGIATRGGGWNNFITMRNEGYFDFKG